MPRYRIAEGGAIAFRPSPEKGNILLQPGQYLPEPYPGGAKAIEALVREGRVIPENYTAFPDAPQNRLVENAPGRDVGPAVPAPSPEGNFNPDEERRRAVVTGDPASPPPRSLGDSIRVTGGPADINAGKGYDPGAPGTVLPPASPMPVQTRHSYFDVDPASLQGKTLDQLNVMIQERDPETAPMPTVEEAIAMLSMHFKK